MFEILEQVPFSHAAKYPKRRVPGLLHPADYTSGLWNPEVPPTDTDTNPRLGDAGENSHDLVGQLLARVTWKANADHSLISK